MLLTVQNFDGLEGIKVEFTWATRVSSNKWETTNYPEFEKELMLFEWEEPASKEVSLLLRRLKGALKSAIKTTGGWKPLTYHEDPKQDSISLESLGGAFYRWLDNEKGYPKAIEYRFENGEELHVPCTGDIAQGLNDINYRGGGWKNRPSRLKITNN